MPKITATSKFWMFFLLLRLYFFGVAKKPFDKLTHEGQRENPRWVWRCNTCVTTNTRPTNVSRMPLGHTCRFCCPAPLKKGKFVAWNERAQNFQKITRFSVYCPNLKALFLSRIWRYLVGCCVSVLWSQLSVLRTWPDITIQHHITWVCLSQLDLCTAGHWRWLVRPPCRAQLPEATCCYSHNHCDDTHTRDDDQDQRPWGTWNREE